MKVYTFSYYYLFLFLLLSRFLTFFFFFLLFPFLSLFLFVVDGPRVNVSTNRSITLFDVVSFLHLNPTKSFQKFYGCFLFLPYHAVILFVCLFIFFYFMGI